MSEDRSKYYDCSDIKESEFWEIYNLCSPYTLTNIERMYALYQLVVYVIENNIEGDFVECGVWRGGSAMLIAKTLVNRNIKNRKIYLYDTYEGMSEPTNSDVDLYGTLASLQMSVVKAETGMSMFMATLEDVKSNLGLTNFLPNNIFLIKGKVESTILKDTILHDKIAVLRLDTDWYESTKHELEHLFPLVVIGGGVIIDDYGHWEGCRKAVDEYFREKNLPVLLNRIDYTGRLLIK